jgi:hypothetical protein
MCVCMCECVCVCVCVCVYIYKLIRSWMLAGNDYKHDDGATLKRRHVATLPLFSRPAPSTPGLFKS